MQAFYPASFLPRPWFWGLLALVVALHLLGLQTLSTSLSVREQPAVPTVAHLRLSVPAPKAQSELSPLPAATMAPSVKVAKVVAPPAASAAATARMDTPDAPAAPKPSPSFPEEPTTPSTPAPEVMEPQTTPAPPPTETASTPVTPPVAPDAQNSQAPMAPVWLAQAKFVWPAPSLLQFELAGTSKGVRYTASASISWKHQDNNYQLRHEIQAFLFGKRSQTSVGLMGATGLLPTRFGDQFRQEQAAHFDRAKGLLIFSANTPSQTIEEGAQDRVSLFVQLAAAMAGTPSLRAEGQQLSLQVVSAKQAEIWTFAVLGTEKLKLPLGDMDSLKLHRLPRNEYDQKIDIWLSPSHGYLPARIRIIQANGDVIEETLQSVGKP
jgi:hypothetical protein